MITPASPLVQKFSTYLWNELICFEGQIIEGQIGWCARVDRALLGGCLLELIYAHVLVSFQRYCALAIGLFCATNSLVCKYGGSFCQAPADVKVVSVISFDA